MPVVAIDSADDARLDDYRAVREPELVRRRGQFIAESRLVVARLVALPRYTIRSILATPSGLAGLRELTGGGAVAGAPPIYVAADAIIEALGGIQFHRGYGLSLNSQSRLGRLPERRPVMACPAESR